MDTLCSQSNISTKMDVNCLYLPWVIVESNLPFKEQYLTFLMDIVDSKSKVSNMIYKETEKYFKSIFSSTYNSEETVECIVQRLKSTSYNSFGAIMAINGILCNQKNYICGDLLGTARNGGANEDMSLGGVLIKKYNLLNELGAAGNTLCENVLKNEFNGDDLSAFYEHLFFAIYKLSVLKNEFDLELFGQILNQLKMFADDSNLLALTAKILSRYIDMYFYSSLYIQYLIFIFILFYFREIKNMNKRPIIFNIQHIDMIYSVQNILRNIKMGPNIIVKAIMLKNIINGYLSYVHPKKFTLISYPLQDQDIIFDMLLTTTNKEFLNFLIAVATDIGTTLIPKGDKCQEIGEAVRNTTVGVCVRALKQAVSEKCTNKVLAKNALQFAHTLYENKDSVMYRYWSFKSMNTVKKLSEMFPNIPASSRIFPSAVSLFDTLEEAKTFVNESVEYWDELEEVEIQELSTEKDFGFIKSFHELLSENEEFVNILSELCTMITDENLEKLVATVLRPRDEARIIAETKCQERSAEFWEKTLILASFCASRTISPQEENFIDRTLRILNDVFTRNRDSDKDFVECFIRYGGVGCFIKYTCFNIEISNQEKAALCLEIFKALYLCKHCTDIIETVPLDDLMRAILNGYHKMTPKLCKASYTLIKQIKTQTISQECKEFIASKINEFYDILSGNQMPQESWENYVRIIDALCWDRQTADKIFGRISRAVEENPHREGIISLVTLANSIMKAWDDVDVKPQDLCHVLEILDSEKDKALFTEYLEYFNSIVKHANPDWRLQEIIGGDAIVHFVFWKCLFVESRQEGTPKSDEPLRVKKCTSERSTQLALDLLYNIAKKDNAYVDYIFGHVVSHFNKYSGYIKAVDKKFDFSTLGRNEGHKYCGLNNRNLKMCFANVIIQALYMVPQFRTFVLNNSPIIPGDPKYKDNKEMFVAMKELFCQMMYSNLKFCEPCNFCKAVWGKDISEQEDAGEFLDKLNSKAEDAFKDDNELKCAFHNILNGKTLKTIACNKGHKKEKDDNFLIIQ